MIVVLASPDSNIHVHDKLGLGRSQPLRQPSMPKASDCSRPHQRSIRIPFTNNQRIIKKSFWSISLNHYSNIHINNGYYIRTPSLMVQRVEWIRIPARIAFYDPSMRASMESIIRPKWIPVLLLFFSFCVFGLLFSGRLSNPARRLLRKLGSSHWHMDCRLIL